MKKLFILAFVVLSATSALANSQLQTLFGNVETYFNSLNGYVVEESSTGVIIDIGSNKKATPGLIITAYEENEPIVHPITGKTLGTKQVALGQLVVQSVFEEYSIARKQGNFGVKAGNTVHIEKPVNISFQTALGGEELEALRSLISASAVFTESAGGYVMTINNTGTVYSCQIMQGEQVIYYDTISTTASKTATDGLILEGGKSLPDDGKYMSIAVGKVFRDRGPVIVAAQNDVVKIFTLDTFEKIAEFEGRFSNVASVELADLDKDGVDEIFISNIIRDTYAYSFIYEHDGKNFVMLQGEIDFMMRSYKDTDGSRGILGQQLNSPDGGYRGDIFYVTYANGKYNKAGSLHGTKGKQLFGFAIFPVETGIGGGKDNLMLSIDQAGRLSMSTFKGNLYSSQDFYGETMHRFKPASVDADKTSVVPDSLIVRPRIEVLDQYTYILAQNDLYTRVFSNTLVFDKSNVGIYRFNYNTFNKLASIDEQTPVIVDIYVYEDDGNKYLLILTSSNKWIAGDPSSIARYRINVD